MSADMRLEEFLAGINNTRTRNALYNNLIRNGYFKSVAKAPPVFVKHTNADDLLDVFGGMTGADLRNMHGIASKTATEVIEQLKRKGVFLRQKAPVCCPHCKKVIK